MIELGSQELRAVGLYRAGILHRGSTLWVGSWPWSFPLASIWPQSGPSCPWSCQTSTTSPRSITASLICAILLGFAKYTLQLPNQIQAWPDRHTALTVSRATSLTPNTTYLLLWPSFPSYISRPDAHIFILQYLLLFLSDTVWHTHI